MSVADDFTLDGLPFSTSVAGNCRESLDSALAQFLSDHRQLLNPEIEYYARSFGVFETEIRRLFPVIQQLESLRNRSHQRLLESQIPDRPPLTDVSTYQLGREIRRTSTTITCRARCRKTRQRTEVTLLPWQDGEVPRLARQFVREARIGMRLVHPAIRRVIDCGRQDGFCFQVMEASNAITGNDFIERRSAEKSRSTAISDRCDEVVRLGLQLCDALKYAHAEGTLHNNLQPSSILISRSGVAQLCDFRIAVPRRDFRKSSDISLSCVAPECCNGASDERGDVYSLGITLYRMAVLQRVSTDVPRRLNSSGWRSVVQRLIKGHMPRRCRDVLQRATAEQPEDRFASAQEMSEALRGIVNTKTAYRFDVRRPR